MEGKATFTLADAATGKTVKRLCEQNMVTDAVKRIFAPPLYAIMQKYSISDFLKSVMPMSTKLFGGIMLLGNNLDENASNVVPGKDMIPVATAGGAYSGSNIMRGTLNENECYATEKGYHFTWDFGTDKANGTIKCAALTSRVFGDSGFAAEDRYSTALMDAQKPNDIGAATTQMISSKGQYLGTFQKQTHTYIRRNIDNSITFLRVKSADPSAIGLNDQHMYGLESEPYYSVVVTCPIIYQYEAKCFVDIATRTVYFFSGINRANGEYSIDYFGVDLDSFTVVSQGTQKLAHDYTRNIAAALYEGSFYLATDTGVDVYSPSGEVLKSYTLPTMSILAWFCTVNGVLMLGNGLNLVYTLYNSKFYPSYNSQGVLPTYSADISLPYCPLCSYYMNYNASNGASIDPFLGITANYFATINNLSEPIEKTNAHTLKVTYDITN